MRRIMVIGCSGAGKSWLSTRIAKALELPLISLDSEYWKPDWTPSEHKAWLRHVDLLSSASDWVIDGNYAGTLDIRMPRADVVIFLDLPRWRAMLGLLYRTLTNLGHVREGMAEGCRERLDFKFLLYAWRCRNAIRAGTLAAMAGLRPDQRGFILKTRKDIDSFAMDLPRSLSRNGGLHAPL